MSLSIKIILILLLIIILLIVSLVIISKILRKTKEEKSRLECNLFAQKGVINDVNRIKQKNEKLKDEIGGGSLDERINSSISVLQKLKRKYSDNSDN